MASRKHYERQPNWQATLRQSSPKARERFVCIMRTGKGGFYLVTPDYKGSFSWGATQDYNARNLAHALTHGYLSLEKGKLPTELAQACQHSATGMNLSAHAEAWWREQGNAVPRPDTAKWLAMYEKWIEFAFADLDAKR